MEEILNEINLLEISIKEQQERIKELKIEYLFQRTGSICEMNLSEFANKYNLNSRCMWAIHTILQEEWYKTESSFDGWLLKWDKTLLKNLLRISPKELLRQQNFSKKSLQAMREAFERAGIDWNLYTITHNNEKQ